MAISDALKCLAKNNILSAPMVRGCTGRRKSPGPGAGALPLRAALLGVWHTSCVQLPGGSSSTSRGGCEVHSAGALRLASQSAPLGPHLLSSPSPSPCTRTGRESRSPPACAPSPGGAVLISCWYFACCSSLGLQVMYPDIEEVQGGDMSPQLLGWIDVADVMRAFLQREPRTHRHRWCCRRWCWCRGTVPGSHAPAAQPATIHYTCQSASPCRPDGRGAPHPHPDAGPDEPAGEGGARLLRPPAGHHPRCAPRLPQVAAAAAAAAGASGRCRCAWG